MTGLLTDTELRKLLLRELLDTASDCCTPAEANKIRLVLSHPSGRFQELWETAVAHLDQAQSRAEAVLLNAALYVEYPGEGEGNG